MVNNGGQDIDHLEATEFYSSPAVKDEEGREIVKEKYLAFVPVGTKHSFDGR